MSEINILLLEDSQGEIDNFTRAKESLEAENGNCIFTLHTFTNITDELYSKLLKKNYDFLIVDLKLNNGSWEGTEEFDGNKFLEHIHNNLNIPIIVNTGNIGNLDARFQTEDNPLFEAIDNTDYDTTEGSTIEKEILKKIFNIYVTGITKVIGKEGKINKTLNKLIWDGGLSNIQQWSYFNDSEKSEKSLSRYILSHIHHELSGDYDDFHPEEIYLKKIGTGKFDTGVILKNNNTGKFYILLTPACDVAQCNTDYYLISEISDISVGENKDIDIDKLSENISKINDPECDINCKKKATERIKKAIDRMKSNDTKKTKFLPRSTLFKGGYINFEKLEKLYKTNEGDYELVCYISSYFLKDIISDFGYYYSRQGQPNLNSDIIIKNLLN